MLEVILTNITPNEREHAGKLAKELDKIKIKFREDYSKGYGNLKFSCPDALTLTHEQEKKFGEVLEKIFCYEKKGAWIEKDEVDYGLANIALKKSMMFLDYANARLYMERLQT
jgi:hypothetical protein